MPINAVGEATLERNVREWPDLVGTQDIRVVNDGPGVVVAGHYDDSRKLNGACKITKRSIVIDCPPAGGLPAVAQPSGAAGKP